MVVVLVLVEMGCSEDVQVVLGGGKNWVAGLNAVNTRVTLIPQYSNLIPLDRSGDSRGGDDRRVEQQQLG